MCPKIGEFAPRGLVRYAWRPERSRAMAYRPTFLLVLEGQTRRCVDDWSPLDHLSGYAARRAETGFKAGPTSGLTVATVNCSVIHE